MPTEAEEKFSQRLQRVNDAIALKEPDMVPMIPWTMGLPFELYPEIGASYKDTMYDFEKASEALIRFHLEFEPDAETANVIYFSGKAGEYLKPTMMDWPGRPGGPVPDNSTYQMLEIEYMKEDEYDELLADPSGFNITKMLPRMYAGLPGMANFHVNPIQGIFTNALAPLAAPGAAGPVKEALQRLLAFMDDVEQSNAAWYGGYFGRLESLGFPGFFNSVAEVPFDGLSDYYRGTTGAFYDLFEQREKVQAVCDLFAEQQIRELAWMQYAPLPLKRVFFPLHKGMDGFMSDADYKEVYWPAMQKMIGALLSMGITPFILTEGPYMSRYQFIADQLKEFPPGSCIVGFEDTHFAEFKKAFKDVACIYGGMSWHTLARGSVQDTVDATKRLIDDAADGGGLIIGTSIPMDNCPRENVEAFFSTAREYGKAR